MSEEELRVALDGLRVRIPESSEDAAALSAEVRAVDRILGEMIRGRKADSPPGADGSPA